MRAGCEGFLTCVGTRKFPTCELIALTALYEIQGREYCACGDGHEAKIPRMRVSERKVGIRFSKEMQDSRGSTTSDKYKRREIIKVHAHG